MDKTNLINKLLDTYYTLNEQYLISEKFQLTDQVEKTKVMMKSIEQSIEYITGEKPKYLGVNDTIFSVVDENNIPIMTEIKYISLKEIINMYKKTKNKIMVRNENSGKTIILPLENIERILF